jgi:hypothetical protein
MRIWLGCQLLKPAFPGVSLLTITFSPSITKRIKRGLTTSLAALFVGLTGNPVLAADAKLRPANELDLGRIGRVADDERSLLRVEWKAGLTRSDESGLLDDMLGRIGRMENTTREIRGLINTLPARSAPPAPAPAAPPTIAAATASEPAHTGAAVPPSISLPEADMGANMAIKLGALAASVMLLLMLFWRRRQTTASIPAPEVQLTSHEVTIAPKVKAPPVTSPSSAVPPAPTFTSPETPPAQTAALPESDPDVSRLDTKDADGNPEQALELANIMLSMGLTGSATQTLIDHIRANPRDALYHWLKLLEIYRTSGHRSDFKEAAAQLRQHFNIQAEDWAKVGVRETPTLEKYERVVERLQGLWSDTEASSTFLRELLEDNRGGMREGFPQPVAEEILFLIELQKHKLSAA